MYAVGGQSVWLRGVRTATGASLAMDRAEQGTDKGVTALFLP